MAHPTDFIDRKLNIIKQIITQRAAVREHSDGDFAYNSYFLEFIYDDDIGIEQSGSLLTVNFYSESDVLLHKVFLFDEDMKNNFNWKQCQDKNCFAISLVEVPVFVLDKTFKIVLGKK